MTVVRRLAALLPMLALGLAPVASGESARTVRDGGVARDEVDLDGALVSALETGPGELLLLVRPADEVDGPRRLLRWRLAGQGQVERVAEGLPGWTKTLVAIDVGGRVELAVGGLGRVDRLGVPAAPASQPSPWLAHPGLDLRSIDYSPLARGVRTEIVSAEAGWLRIWRPEGEGAPRLDSERRLPLEVEREATGLEITSPPVARLVVAEGAERVFAGPVARGARRLLVTAVDAEGEDRDCWLALPGVEKVERSWLVAFDGEPALVAHTQDGAELNVFEDQRYRVFPLGADRTRRGRAPRLAVEVDSKRWQDSTIAVADVDGDGDDDLVLVRPEGMTGGDLVVEVFPGRKGVRFERGSRRTDIDSGPGEWRMLSGAGAPTLATLGDGRLEVWRFAEKGRRAIERRPTLSVLLPRDPARGRRIEVTAGGEDSGIRDIAVTGREILGDVATAGGSSVLVLEGDETGAERLYAFALPGR